jgi:hypothetical protein
MVRNAAGASPSRGWSYYRAVHLRLPAIDHGVASFLWGLCLGLYVLLGLLAIGVSRGTAVILAALTFAGIFLYVRIYGEEELRPQTKSSRGRIE